MVPARLARVQVIRCWTAVGRVGLALCADTTGARTDLRGSAIPQITCGGQLATMRATAGSWVAAPRPQVAGAASDRGRASARAIGAEEELAGGATCSTAAQSAGTYC
jgi:hypothetical protein